LWRRFFFPKRRPSLQEIHNEFACRERVCRELLIVA
jgi:hypothetical protein